MSISTSAQTLVLSDTMLIDHRHSDVSGMFLEAALVNSSVLEGSVV